jgi:hypothetical protein
MGDDTHVIDNGWDALPEYADKAADGDDAVTVSISTTPGEWLVNTVDSVVVPMSMAELVDGLRARTLTERSLVWRQGMQEWACVDAVPQLKLAARMAPTPATAARARPPEKPSAPPVRHTPPRQTASPHAGLSRRSTLPFGLPTPPGSRPGHAKPTLPLPSLSPDEPGVLAVYARPAATISFDLSPEQPLRAPAPPSVPAPHTLAPTTADSSPRSAPPSYRGADLSVVAAADFRAVQRSGKRSVLLWSLVSAAAASLLTFWLSRGTPVNASVTAAHAPERGQTLAAPPPPVPPSPAPLASEPTPPAVPAAASAEPSPSPAPLAVAAARTVPKAKPARRRKVVAPPEVASGEPSAAERTSSTKSPSSEPNPYDVKLEDEVPAAKPPAAHGSGLDDAPGSEASASTPGF